MDASSSAMRRSACHRSCASCILIHKSGPLPQNLPSRRAISGVTAVVPASTRWRVCRVTPSALATLLTVIPSAGSTSSRNTSPGCAGHRPALRLAMCSVIAGFLVVLLEVDTMRVAFPELENNAPRSVDMDRVFRRSMAAQGVEIEAGDVHVLRPTGLIKSIKAPENPVMNPGIDLPCCTLFPKLRQSLVPEALDHCVTYDVTPEVSNERPERQPRS